MVGRSPSLSGASYYPTLPHGKHRRVSSNLPRPRVAHSVLKAILYHWHLGINWIHFVSMGDLCIALNLPDTSKYYVAALKESEFH